MNFKISDKPIAYVLIFEKITIFSKKITRGVYSCSLAAFLNVCLFKKKYL